MTKENYNKIIKTGIYKSNINITQNFRTGTFRVYEKNNELYMIDLYFNEFGVETFKLTDNNIDKFELILDLNEYKKIYPCDLYKYRDSDLTTFFDSDGKSYYLKKDAIECFEKVENHCKYLMNEAYDKLVRNIKELNKCYKENNIDKEITIEDFILLKKIGGSL